MLSFAVFVNFSLSGGGVAALTPNHDANFVCEAELRDGKTTPVRPSHRRLSPWSHSPKQLRISAFAVTLNSTFWRSKLVRLK